MLNRLSTAAVRASIVLSEAATLRAAGSARKGTVYHPAHGRIIGFNFGTSVRPAVAPIRVNRLGDETIESYLARGGRILTGAPKVAPGAVIVGVVPSRPTRVAKSRG
jgi:hypothetical protein